MTSGLGTKELDVTASVKAADLATANLEIAVTNSESASNKLICLRISPDHVGDIASLGFKVVSIANNHALDFGVDGLRDTLSNVKTTGLLPVGAGENLSESLMPVTMEAAGRRVAIIAASTTLPNSSAAGPTSPGIAPVRVVNRYRIDGVTMDESPGMSPFVETQAVGSDVESLCVAVRNCAGEADLVAVHMHWGVPMGWVAPIQDEIADYQRPLAHALIDAGASLIIGHHPHVVQGVEFYKNAPILYSLGNFVKHKIEAVKGREEIHPPYRMASLLGPWNKIGCLALIEWAPSAESPNCSFLILQFDENGEPHLADKTAGEALQVRLNDQCRTWGTSVALRTDESGAYLDFHQSSDGQ